MAAASRLSAANFGTVTLVSSARRYKLVVSRHASPSPSSSSSSFQQQVRCSNKHFSSVCCCGSQHGAAPPHSRLRNVGNGLWVRRKRRWKLLGGKASEQLESGLGNEGDFAAVRASPWTASAVASAALDSNGSSSRTSEERLSASNYIPNFSEETYGSDLPNEPPEVAESGNAQEAPKAYEKFIGVQPVRGRFEVRLQKDRRAHSLVLSSQKEAAKAYDKAAYKLEGPSAKTNFELTEKERLHIDGMEWEDLLLEIQLQDFARSSPSRLGFPGVYYREGDHVWMVKIRHAKKTYLGYFSSMTEATKAYDLAAYKLEGRDALLSRPLTSAERMELMNHDWGSLVAKLGLKASAGRQKGVSECRGVRLRPSGNYLASFAHKGYYFYLGTFGTKDAAAKAYDLFAFKLLGENAKLNSELVTEEREFISSISAFGLRNHLASEAIIAPKILHLGARGARLVQGQWEVCLENPRKDRIYTSSASSEQEAVKVHDMVVSKLHNGMGRTYSELTELEQREVDSADWTSVASKFGLRQMPSYHGVNRLISGLWQSYIRHAGAYLAIGTFDSAETAARCSDKCEYKRLGNKAILNFSLSDRQKREIDAVDWGTLIAGFRAEQAPSPVLTKLGGPSAISSPNVSREKKWMLLLCHEQLLQQQMTRRAPKVGRQLVVANPALAAQFSGFNRRADESPMVVDEVMEGSNTPLLWQCSCGNIVLKAPMSLLHANQVLCKMEGCTAKPLFPRRMRPKEKKSSDSNGASRRIIIHETFS
ncbi:unnamed protein product [Calypogeia fissa]